MSDVYEFNIACGVPMRSTPGLPANLGELDLARSLIDEEVNTELLKVLWENPDDLVAVADAAIDAIYVITGLLLRLGIPGAQVWQIVQAANMAKVDPITGQVLRRADGKIMKPPGWEPPEEKIRALLISRGWRP